MLFSGEKVHFLPVFSIDPLLYHSFLDCARGIHEVCKVRSPWTSLIFPSLPCVSFRLLLIVFRVTIDAMAESPLAIWVVDDEENRADVIITDLMLERPDGDIEILKATQLGAFNYLQNPSTSNNSVPLPKEPPRKQG